MDTKAIEEYSKWARRELIERVGDRLYALGLSEMNRISADATVIGDRVLTDEERAQRAELIERIDTEGEQAFVERMAYTWFNRLAAIRYMEVHDFLPSRTRILSGEDGSTNSQALKEISSLDLPALDTRCALDLALQGTKDDELFNMVLLAQCDQLADCMPAVFEHLGDSDVLTLPVRLYTDKDGVVARLVNDIPESAWDDVEILGWMYQFYVHELKRNYYDSKRKATVDDIGPATQTFTPDWIVRYMVENSLGRLWMLNNPASQLREQMKYYIEPEGQVEDFIAIDSPEDITFCDPACGSGHILVYAFDLLWQMYEERGYGASEIATLILSKNLHGIEIDPRAAQYAVLQLTMRARERDRRFLNRGVTPDICVLEPVAFDKEERELLGRLAQKNVLLDALEHLTECGSLLNPEADDIASIHEALDGLSDNLAGEVLKSRLESALASCESLVRTFDVVVTNPPYMGSNNFNSWMSRWTKSIYPEDKGDLCVCFIRRELASTKCGGYMAMATSNSWMFLSSYESIRQRLIDTCNITSLVQLSVHGFKGIAAQVCAFALSNSHVEGVYGGYIRLNDFDHHTLQDPKTLEAIENHECGWFYRADADSFKDIPGSPIAYWASEAVHRAFKFFPAIKEYSTPRQGTITGNNDYFLKMWWETSYKNIDFNATERSDKSDIKWYLHCKGGDYRKWYGNNLWVINWQNNGEEIKTFRDDKGRLLSRPQNTAEFFKPGVTYTELSSGAFSSRIAEHSTFNVSGPTFIVSGILQKYILGYTNSTVFQAFLNQTATGMHYTNGTLANLPFNIDNRYINIVEYHVNRILNISTSDWNSAETAWKFSRHPLCR